MDELKQALHDLKVEIHGKFEHTLKPAGEGNVGYDLYVPPGRPLSLPYNCRRRVDTGVIVKTPEPLFMLLVPRSSTGTKRAKGVRFANTVGIIDPSYQGQNDTTIVTLEREDRKKDYLGTFQYVKSATNNSVIAQAQMHFPQCTTNGSEIVAVGDNWYDVFELEQEETIIFQPGDRFAQVLFIPAAHPELLEKALEAFREDDRGGHGSTGK